MDLLPLGTAFAPNWQSSFCPEVFLVLCDYICYYWSHFCPTGVLSLKSLPMHVFDKYYLICLLSVSEYLIICQGLDSFEVGFYEGKR